VFYYIEEVEKFIWIKDRNAMKNKCLKLEAIVSQLEMPQPIKDSIRKNLLNIFKDRNIDNIKFSARFSATDQDSEEMSRVGQMMTCLGVKGLNNIYSSVMKCWSSQFNHIAIGYKLEYGQPTNILMVDCDCAGVALLVIRLQATKQILLSNYANYELGEVN